MHRASSSATLAEPPRNEPPRTAREPEYGHPDRSAHRKRWPLYLFGILLVLGITLLVAAATSYSTVKSAKDELTRAKDLLSQVADNPSGLLNHPGRAADAALLRQAAGLASYAHGQLTGSMGISYIGLFPWLHTQTAGAVQLASDATTAARQATRLVGEIDALSSSASISNGQVPLASLATLETHVASAADQMVGLIRNPAGLVGPLGTARSLFNRTASSVSLRLTNAAQDLIAARTFMGANGPRTYLVAGENNDTMRDQGIVLSYATITFDRGKFHNTPSGNTGTIEPSSLVNVPVPAGTNTAFGRFAPTGNWQSTNLTADFPWSASVMAAMYKQVTGTSVDGVIAADVPALARILGVIGPVTVPGIATPLTSANVADVLLNQLYAEAPTSDKQAARTDKVAAAISAVFSQLQGGNVADIVDLGDALAKAAAGGHLMLWSSDPAEESVFVMTGISGDVSASDPTRTVHVAVDDATGAKLDFFVRPSLHLDVRIAGNGTADVTGTVEVADNAPSGPPSLQLGPDGFSQTMAGQFVGLVNFWGPRGDVQKGSILESGLSLSQQDIAVDPGKTGTSTFAFAIPRAVVNGSFLLRLVPQPWLDPESLQVSLRAPGWKITSGSANTNMIWDSTSTLVWGLEKG